MATADSNFTTPGIPFRHAEKAIDLLAQRLAALVDLQLTLKHVHWNVVGPNFIGVHEMLDPQTDVVRAMTDSLAERIATLGGEPTGTPGAVVDARTWDDYPLGRADVEAHLAALDVVYTGVINDHRHVLAQMGELDPVTEDLLVGQTAELELCQWFVRSHLQTSDGRLPTSGTKTVHEAVAAVGRTAAPADAQGDRPVPAGADRPPTPDEEQAAERHGPVAEKTAEAYREMAEVGANVEGEGRIS